MITTLPAGTVHIGDFMLGFKKRLGELCSQGPVREAQTELSLPATSGNPSIELRHMLGQHPSKRRHNRKVA